MTNATLRKSARSLVMSALYLSIGRDAEQTVVRPRPSDAIGAALRGAFASPPLPEDMARLLRRLDKEA